MLLPLERNADMKSGAINIPTNDGNGIPDNNPVYEREESDTTLRSTIRVVDSLQATLEDATGESLPVVEGETLRDELVNAEVPRVTDEGALDTLREGREPRADITRFIHSRGNVLLLQRTEAENARKIIEQATGATLEPGRIDIDSFESAHPEAEHKLEWGRTEEGNLFANEERLSERAIRKQLDESDKAQLSWKGLKWNGRRLYGTITKSGYVEIYRDEGEGRIGTREFTRFVIEEVMDHAYLGET